MGEKKSSRSRARTVAVIELGSTGIRMAIANLRHDGGFDVLERASRPCGLGRDVFSGGSIGRAATKDVVATLGKFVELARGYGVAPEDVRAIGTSALREAENRETFVDRVSLQAGIDVRIVEDVEENHYMYLAVLKALGDDRAILSRANTVILEVGGGSTELMLLRRGKMVAAHSFRIGTVRLGAFLRSGSEASMDRYLDDNISTTLDVLETDMQLSSVRQAVVIGADVRFVASRAGREAGRACSIVDRKGFDDFVASLVALGADRGADNLGIGEAEAEELVPGLAIACKFLSRTAVEEVLVPDTTIRDGVLAAMAAGPDPELENELRKQVVASSIALGRRYRFDERHALHVAETALAIFDAMEREHGLDPSQRLRLEVAAILHDVGTFVRPSGHHRHSEYIIANSEIFGLHGDDLAVISSVARYHRKSTPTMAHQNFAALTRANRMAVYKLSAILRVADALDRGHGQRVSVAELERRGEYLVIRAGEGEDYSLERLSLAEKGDLFEDAFGLKAVLS
jgi:exopolyphosphatase/guanosine-5'-triphosphate,3'-diphosphate pyrophosphatase